MVPVYVLNLAADQERWHAIQAIVAERCFLDLVRVPAVDGTALPDAACFPLTRNRWSVNYKGTLACFLGHVRAWERIAASEHRFSLFIEDDVRLHNLEMLSGLRLPDGVDLAFCNDRTCYQPADGEPTFLPLLPAMRYVANHLQGIGGDGYLLTPAALGTAGLRCGGRVLLPCRSAAVRLWGRPRCSGGNPRRPTSGSRRMRARCERGRRRAPYRGTRAFAVHNTASRRPGQPPRRRRRRRYPRLNLSQALAVLSPDACRRGSASQTAVSLEVAHLLQREQPSDVKVHAPVPGAVRTTSATAH